MKLRIRCNKTKTTKVFAVSDERNELTTLSEIREAASGLFNVGTFQLSLNNSDVLEDETKTLLDYGVVGGDLIYLMVESGGGDDCSTASQSSSQSSQQGQQLSRPAGKDSGNQSISDQPGTSKQSYEHEQMETGNQSTQTGTGAHSHMNTGNETATAEYQSMEAGAQSQSQDCDPVDYAVVNRCLQEPVLCRDSSETNMPSLLQVVHSAASPQDTVEALCVVLHVLMLETGYVTCSQKAAPSPNATVLPSTWRQPGCYRVEYTFPCCQESTCSVTVISAGTSAIVHGKVTGDHSVTRQCTLKPKDFVKEPVSDISHCYCNLARLSMVFKDSIANPLVSDMRIAAGIEDIYGLLALNQEVKLQIVSYLDVRSLLRLSCVNNEMYTLSRDPYLWRRLYLRDFGNRKDNSLSQHWRKLYIQEYKSRKERRKMMSRMTMVTPPSWGPPNNPFAGPSNWIPQGPGMIGGDYDLFPNFPGGLPGIPGRMGPRQPMMPRPRYDLIGPNPDHEPDIPGMAPLGPRGPSFGGRGRGNPFGGGFGPRFI